MEPGSARREVKHSRTLIGDGRLLSLNGQPVGVGRYSVFGDGSGWFACDISAIEVGSILWLELDNGARRRVEISRKAPRNVLFRPVATSEEAVESSPM